MSSFQCPPLPYDTARAAESVFGREHPYLRIGESLKILWEELTPLALESADEFLSNSFYPYSLATVLQSWETLTDRQMAQATRTRLDMKYALHLPLNFPGLEPSTLCAFRQHVLTDRGAIETLQEMIQRLGIFTNREKSSLDVNGMITTICLASRAEIIFDCMGIALESVATCDPNWLKAHTPPHWYKRYHQKPAGQKIPHTAQEIESLVQAVGRDGRHLLKAIESSNAPILSQLPEIQKLRNAWQCQFVSEGDSLTFRESRCLSCGSGLKFITTISTRKEEAGADHKKSRSLHDTNSHEQGK
ncbi:MAG: transposase [Chloroflexota bacterium]